MNKLSILAIILFVGCYNPNGKEIIIVNKNTNPNADFRIVEIDGCEYIEIDEGSLQNQLSILIIPQQMGLIWCKRIVILS